MDIKRILGIVILAAGALVIGMLVGQTWFYTTGDETWIPTWWKGVNFSGVVKKYDGKMLEVYDETTKKSMKFDIDQNTNFIGGTDYIKEKDAKIIVKYKPTKGRNIARRIQQVETPQGAATGSPSPAGSPVETGIPAPSPT